MKTIEEAGREQKWCPNCESTNRDYNEKCDDPMQWHNKRRRK